MNALKTKLTNLVSVSRRDSSIYTSLNNSHISIINFVDKNKIRHFFGGKEQTLEIKFDLNLEKIEKTLLNSENYEDFINNLNLNQIYINKRKREIIKHNFFDTKLKSKIISDSIASLNNYKNLFKNIMRNANEIKKDRGTWNLFLTRYYLKGKTPYKKQFLNSPLIFHKVEIIFEANKIYLKKISETNDINEKLFVLAQRDVGKQNKSISDLEITNDIDKIKFELENAFETKINFSEEGKMDFLLEEENEDNEIFNNLVIEDRVCLGIFEPEGGKLKEDLEKIVTNDLNTEIFEKFPICNIDEICQMELSGEPFHQVSNLNIYQKYAVRSSLLDNTIIEGPPGTGKSEVISNIISNIIYQKKDAVVVSEKIIALEVIKERLLSLNIFALLIYNDDKEKFYDSIINLATLIGNNWVTNKINNIEKINSLNEQLFSYLNNWRKAKLFLSKYKNFSNYSHDGVSFFELIKLIDKLGGSNIVNEIQNQNFVPIVNDVIVKNDISKSDFFASLKKLNDFIIDFKIQSEQEFNVLLKESLILKNILEKYNVHITKDFIESIKNNSIKLSNYLIGKNEYQDILRINPYLFFDDVITFKKFCSNAENILPKSFFDNLNKNIAKAKRLNNVLVSCKESDRKYIIDKFIETGEILEKKPISKLFYTSKLTTRDSKLLKSFSLLESIDFAKYSDFDYIFKNSDIFNPLSVVYFFNENIFDDKYLHFIKNKFYMFSFQMYLINQKFNINESKFDDLVKTINAKNDFINNFPEFVNKNIFQSTIDIISNTEWKKCVELILKIHKLNLVSNLSTLSHDDKNFILKAINIAMSKKRPTIFSYIQKYGLALKHLFPIWLGRPDQIALYTPLRKEYFSYGIFDEASQMFLERAYPLLFRAKIKIIAGDDKQLKPSNFFVSRDDDDNVEFDILDDLDSQDSLLDRAITSPWNKFMLKNHYRSEYKELIEFSSENIYDKNLNYASINSISIKNPLEVIDVNGNFDESKNIEEANKIISLIEENINKYRSILVITFNSKQSIYINSLISKTEFKNNKVIEKFNNGLLEVINIENVQGNEADLVILSITYGKKKDEDNLRSNFGPLIQKNGSNRLNVAITRSKSKMIVVKSFKSNEIKDSNNENLMMFKKYIYFLDKHKEDQDKIFKNFSDSKFKNNILEHIFSALSNKLIEFGLVVLRNYNVGNKNIDIAILEKNKVVIGIKFTKLKITNDEYKIEQDIDDQLFLESRGYKIFRIFEHEWLIDHKNVLQKFYETLKLVWNYNK